METKANYVLIGFFTLGVLAAGFAFVHWFRSIGRVTVSANYHVVFQGPVGGLRTGATVLFNGMRVGEVSGLELNRQDPKQVIATVKIDANTPVRSDTVVGLDFQGLTGIASIGLKGGDTTAGPLPEGPDGVPTLVADASATQDITASAREVLRKLDSFISDNSGSVHTSLKNIETFTDTLKGNSERIDRILASVDKSMAGVQLLTGTGEDSKPGQVSETLKSFKTLADDVDQRTLKHLDNLILTARGALATFDRAVTNFDRNPSRVIFGGGSSAAPAPATTSGPRRAQ
jgi:phospholipid/cholesterol/gamma-HCH transport system substrate-binding protein